VSQVVPPLVANYLIRMVKDFILLVTQWLATTNLTRGAFSSWFRGRTNPGPAPSVILLLAKRQETRVAFVPLATRYFFCGVRQQLSIRFVYPTEQIAEFSKNTLARTHRGPVLGSVRLLIVPFWDFLPVIKQLAYGDIQGPSKSLQCLYAGSNM